MTDIIKLMAVNLHRYEWNRWVRDGVPPEEQHWMGAARACLTALSEAGWVVVPREATEKMKDAGAFGPTTMSYGGDTNTFDYISEDDAAHLWSAMVAAGRGET